MKHNTVFAIAVGLLASFATVGIASAQVHAARATVPFDFNVGNRWVPAGTYIISSEVSHPGVLFIRSTDSKVALLSLAQDDGRPSGASKLIFKRYGDQYFLREVVCSMCGIDAAFVVSKHEKLARERLEAGLLNPANVALALAPVNDPFSERKQ